MYVCTYVYTCVQCHNTAFYCNCVQLTVNNLCLLPTEINILSNMLNLDCF